MELKTARVPAGTAGCFGLLILAASAQAVRVPRIELPRETGRIVREATPSNIAAAADPRGAHAVSAREAYEAIRRALERSGIAAATTLKPDDISLQADVLVAPADAGLEVLRSDFDAGLQRGKFLLWASRDPKVLPFVVTARFDGNLEPIGLRATFMDGKPRADRQTPAVASAARAKAEVLVQSGQPATLLLHSAALRLTADVVALERGTLGQAIRVRVVDTGKVFRAHVDGRAHLDLGF